jgi:hypothetical protein
MGFIFRPAVMAPTSSELLSWFGQDLLTQFSFARFAALPLDLESFLKRPIFSLIQLPYNPPKRYFCINQTMALREKARNRNSTALIEEYALLINGVTMSLSRT